MISAIIQIVFMILEYLVKRKGVSDESKRIFIKLAEELRKSGLNNVRSRYEAESQIDAIDKEWEKRHEQRKS